MRRFTLALGAAVLLTIASLGSVAAGGRGIGEVMPPSATPPPGAPLGPICGQQIADYASTTQGVGGGVGPYCAYGVLYLN